MASQQNLDQLFLDIAERISQMSHAVRSKVGAVIVLNDNIISMGWNGTPSGMDNNCEDLVYPEGYDECDGVGGPPDMVLRTKQMVLHAESNALMKLASAGGKGAEGATLYCTYSPCPECAKLIKQAKITRVVYRNHYRLPEGIQMLEFLGVKCHQLLKEKEAQRGF